MTDTKKLALAMEAVEAAKELVGQLVGACAGERAKLVVDDGLYDRIDDLQIKFAGIVAKLEAMK